ncbi:hypothetical protein D9758_007849 [Tetrapyrgos nigripes]|uniref:Glycoside hydrolase family 5 domain-containing protein n=1 Tax=Tetrapyrgos nigripes TaxID=182062 RepID=A0A8H5CY57_9AGAR|nr:hypothetical protein D9758_007849 [Tetrapyrgos nigripes]
MGGGDCQKCTPGCIVTEGLLFTVWIRNTWFNQTDVDEFKDLGINTVRILLGYWIVEEFVDRKMEFYPRSGIEQLHRGLKQLKEAGIVAILGHHVLPGVGQINEPFSGACTDDPQFYTDQNYHRALVWAAVLTGLSHLYPDFSSVFSILAANEPVGDANRTPGFGKYFKQFVQTVRATEALLGAGGRQYARRGLLFNSPASGTVTEKSHSRITETCGSGEVCDAILEAIPILINMSSELGGFDMNYAFGIGRLALMSQPPLMTNFMEINWQHNSPSNPADVAMGPQSYDHHLYYYFGDVAAPDPESYMKSICNLRRREKAAKFGNNPMWFGEWSLGTEFIAMDEFMRDWADAQKFTYSKSLGWIFWNWKLEESEEITALIAGRW